MGGVVRRGRGGNGCDRVDWTAGKEGAEEVAIQTVRIYPKLDLRGLRKSFCRCDRPFPIPLYVILGKQQKHGDSGSNFSCNNLLLSLFLVRNCACIVCRSRSSETL